MKKAQKPLADASSEDSHHQERDEQFVKCLVWDLDNTLWHGVLLEGDEVFIKEETIDIIKILDSRGILQSIASKNDYSIAMNKLREFGIQEYFLYPQIQWGSKVSSIKKIAKSLDISLDAVAFIDDQPAESAEVAFALPQVLCISAVNLDQLLTMPRMNPPFVTGDSRTRRLMYLDNMSREKYEEQFEGSKEEFWASLNMVFTISAAKIEDLRRAEELTVRTHQLNTTGYTYSYDELVHFCQSQDYKVFITSLQDIYGSYGKIGLALVECNGEIWEVKLLLMSCRVISKGVGAILLQYIMRLAKEANVILRADFVPNDVNRLMYVTYKFAGFKEVDKVNNTVILENDLSNIQSYPEYVTVRVVD